MIIHSLLIVIAYLLGSLSSAVLVCKLRGLPDPRSEGSHNAGATNVLRIGDKTSAAMVLAGDVLKGILAVVLGNVFGASNFIIGMMAVACVAGHIYPVFFDFRGGKGVATALGVTAALSMTIAITAAIVWLLVAKLFRFSSLAALVATGVVVLMSLFVKPHHTFTFIAIAVLIFYKHRDNIARLKDGTESKISLD